MLKRKISLFLIIAIILQSLPFTAFAGMTSVNSTSDNLDVINTHNDNFVSRSSGKYGVGEFMGNMNYNYPLFVPPGRNNLTPSIEFNYSSARRNVNSIVGLGWEFNLPKIERYAETGATEDLYTENKFTSHFAGGNGKLIPQTNVTLYGNYTPAVINSKVKHEFLADKTWKITDNTGTVYILGADTNARMESADGTKIHTWFLSSVTDTNGNQILYEYTKNQGNSYLKRIKYGHESYPFEVRFEPYYSGSIQSFNTLPDYSRQFPVTEQKEPLDKVEVLSPLSNERLIYDFASYRSNGVNYLSQIQKKGKDFAGAMTMENPTSFSYGSYGGERSFTPTLPADASIYERMWINQKYQYAVNALYTDYNNDGWLDILSNYLDVNCESASCYEYHNEVYLNQKNGTWEKITLPVNNSSDGTLNYYDDYNRVFKYITSLDLYGSNYQTKVRGTTYYRNYENAYLPTADAYALSAPVSIGKFGDLNGDGLLDVFSFGTSPYSALSLNQVFKNVGGSWESENITLPSYIQTVMNGFLQNGSVLIQDLNGDGLDDILIMEQHLHRPSYCQDFSYTNKNYVLLNDGNNNFIDVSSNIQFPTNEFYSYQFADEYYTCNTGNRVRREVSVNNINFFDFNRDGLADIHKNSARLSHNGSGWDNLVQYGFNNSFYGYTYKFGGGETLDLNYDGILDQIIYTSVTDENNSQRRRIRQNVFPDLPVLMLVNEPLGKKINVEYTPASGYLDENNNQLNPDLPLAHLTVSKLTQDDGLGNLSETNYVYSGGKLYHPQVSYGHQKRELLGFAKVEKTLPDQSKVVSEYLQGDNSTNFAEKGSLKNSKIYQDENTVLQELQNFYQTYERETGSFQSHLVTQFQTIYAESNQSNKHSTATQFAYDSHGNMIQQIDFGNAILGTSGTPNFSDYLQDKITTNIQYAINEAKHIYALGSQTESKDFDNNILARQKTFYDQSEILGEVTKGNSTKNTVLKNQNSLQEVLTETTYNQYGMPLTFKNARGFTTSTTYDGYNLYPQKTTNAKGQETSYLYSYLLGKVKEVTDPNGAKQKTIFDGLGRTLETQVSNPENPNELITTAEINYNYATVPVNIQTNIYAGHDNIEVFSKTYLDGFERTLQTSIELEGANQYSTTRTVYDVRGNVQKQLLAQVYTDTDFQEETTNKPSIDYTYDALNRPLSVTNSLGTSSMIYKPFETRLETQNTDANGRRKDFVYDARGNLTQVKEYLDGVAHVINYSYDKSGNLTKIRDAELNEKSFTYDLWGRKLTEELLHKTNDYSPASYSYEYDDNSNVVSMNNPQNQTVSYVYDELDRLTTENYDSQVQTAYTYDQGNYGIGRLSTVTSPNIVKNFVYDVLGRITSEIKTIDEESYTTAFTYDLTGKPQSLIYPDESVVDYTYNNANFLESIALNNEPLITNFDYAPTLAVSQIDYANGVSTENTFDINQLYRLTEKLTTKDTQKLQDLSYSFDTVGNITQINDVSDLRTAKNAVYGYDDLHRLTSATITNSADSQDYVRNFSYSPTGNILNKSDLGLYAYTAKHPQAVSQVGGDNFTYDLNGNLVSDGEFTHTWDYKNRLNSSISSGSVVNYVYDEGKARIKKVNSGATVTYVSDYFETEDEINTVHVFANDLKIASVQSIVPQVVSTSSGSGICNPPATGDWNIVEDCDLEGFVQLDGGLTLSNQSVLTVKPAAVLEIDFVNQKLSVGTGSRVLVEADGRIRQKTTSGEFPATIYQKLAFHHADHLTGANVETDIEGNVVEVLDYYPYGETRLDEKSGHYENNYKYTGQELDNETDLYYYGARYYDAKIGRFTGIDPWFGDLSDPQSLNKYAYVRNNPLKYVDPTGEKIELVSRGLDAWWGVIGVHTFLRITPDNPEDFGLSEDAENYNFTLGGYYNKESQKLEKDQNQITDVTLTEDDTKQHAVIATPEGMDDTEFIQAIQQNYDEYDNDLDYDAFSRDGEGYNCNDFSSSLILESGGEMPYNYNPSGLNPGLKENNVNIQSVSGQGTVVTETTGGKEKKDNS